MPFKLINHMSDIDGLIIMASDHELKDGLFAHQMNQDTKQESDLIELVGDTESLSI